jgi:hypothetical protein
MRTTAKQISPGKRRFLYASDGPLRKGVRASPKFPDFYQDFLIDGYMAAI